MLSLVHDLPAEEPWKSPRLFLRQFLIKTLKHTFQGITLSIVRIRSFALSDKLKKILFTTFTISLLAFSGISRLAFAAPTSTSRLPIVQPLHRITLLDPSFDPQTVADLSTAPNADICGAVGWAEETTLDVTMSHGLAPGAKIVLVASADCFDSSLNRAEAAVVSQDEFRGSIMSQSFGEPDDLVGCTAVDPVSLQCTATDPTIKATADAIYELAKERQWTVIASSGDDGANTNTRFLGTTELTPSWPSTNPLNLAVGGTQGQPYGGQFGSFPGRGKTFTCAADKKCNTGLVVINGGESGCKTAATPGVPSSCFPVGYGGG